MKNFELNKIAASILLAGLIAMISGFITNILYKPHEVLKERGYMVEVADTNSTVKGYEEEKIDISLLMSTARVDKGIIVAKKCAACHSFDKGQPHKLGPNLWNIVGKPAGSKGEYLYSTALKEKNITWSYEELFLFLKSPKKYMPGTKMSFIGLKKPNDIANVIEFLRNQGDNAYPLP